MNPTLDSTVEDKNIPPQSVSSDQNENQTDSPEKQAETKKEVDWRIFREQREKDRKAREEAEKRAQEESQRAEALKAAMDSLLNKNQNANHYARQNDYLDDREETEEQRIAKAVEATIAKRDAELERQRQEKERIEYPIKLRKNYPDIDQVTSAQNLDYLDFHYPEVSRPLGYMAEGYDKWEAIYKAVKKFVPQTDINKEIKKMENNLSKPQAMGKAGTVQGGNAMPSARLDADRKAANWERMQRTMKEAS